MAASVGAVSLLVASCGGSPKAELTPKDVDAVAAAVGDVVYQCGSYTAGHIAAPDTEALERDVRSLLDAYERLEPDTSFEVGALPVVPRETTLREELRFAARILDDGCVPELGQRLTDTAAD